MPSVETLKQFPAFSAVPPEQLRWLLDRAEEESYPREHVITKPGEPIDYLTLVLDGRIRIDGGPNGQADEIAVYDPHSILGLLPFSRLVKAVSRVVAEQPSHVLLLHRNHLHEMPAACYELTEALVHQMTTRVRDFTKLVQQNEKLTSLGRLSAGLAHELNNPVAAVVRSADTLREHMRATPDAFKAIMRLDLSDEHVDAVNEALFRRLDQPPPALTLIERSNLEDELTDWLDDHDVPDSLDLAGPLVEYGFKVEDLDWVLDRVGDNNIGGVTNWLVNNLVTEKLVMDISEASKRISTLVGSIKNYTHMDRGAGRENVRLGEGIRSTLTLLNHKLKAKHISVEMNVPDDLPMICGYPGELNQVWTNLIDNAIDALPDGGKLMITGEIDREFVLTKVIDNGTGIPDDVKDKIFDPFFTTKGIGQGTGLGLDIVKGIVKHHNGSIKVQSQPGHTEFSVCIPIE
ncbi:GHKL domain-containing protein [Fibrisoma montanum]|uniref:histidine kinase n=1 Tax=Fibrisoma montanum TaxID=2305895 RepID=A0A418LZQ7_9BACT|nr:ATP-binding protein [Fibrisoma montanum]RIV18704.1 GHKL domain-containing protein [Fibrisoma montanum]